MLFETDRIKLRKMKREDIEVYNRWSNDEGVVRNTYPNLDRYSMEDTEKFYNKVNNSSSSKTYIIEDVKKQKSIGITTLLNIDFYNRNAEFIIDIGEKEYWGKGYGKEAMVLMLQLAFLELNLNRVYLRVFSFNERAIKLYEKIGFLYEGRLREAIFRDGKWHDIVNMGMLQREYLG
ncbi:GNAT family N-acetyltransferase [Oceanirhabdus seepicola]|uniref:GNAT family N-acetyltransferase n=1 Tax=Oceanirhabdus seepicola TaxID=2828781 RepID=A0A9J6P4H5_9CLOT|nr:GNAT family protein [Oceanirhabdus seepicola]MCM1991615.1 GNAT family N-acetyltransferase [Oceanirhabdus seepicola]